MASRTDGKHDNIARLHTRGDGRGGAQVASAMLREFVPLTHLVNLIPRRAQRGLASYDVKLTCLDVTEEYLAVGSSLGIVFMYDRHKQTLLRLNADIKVRHELTITCIKLLNGLDYLVAVGTSTGLLVIFQLPSILPGRNKQLQQFTVPDVHATRISALEWSRNGMKLFSGDEDGVVVCTELNAEQRQSQSLPLLRESHKIIQLSYAHMILLVSTRYRTVICKTSQDNALIQVGQKDRKCLGNFGACFLRELCKPADLTLYTTRPGLRLWKAGVEGVVANTYLYKEALNKPGCAGLDIVQPMTPNEAVTKAEDKQFGPVVIYDQKQVLTWNESTLYVLDPSDNSVVGSSNQLGSLIDVATVNDEIFVLRLGSEFKILRLAHHPETRIFKGQIQDMVLNLTPPPSPTDHLSPPPSAPRRSKSPLSFLMGKLRRSPNDKKPSPRYSDASTGGASKPSFQPIASSHPAREAADIAIPTAIHADGDQSNHDSTVMSVSTESLPPIVKLSDDLAEIKVDIGSGVSSTGNELGSPAVEAIDIGMPQSVVTSSNSGSTVAPSSGTNSAQTFGSAYAIGMDEPEGIVFKKKPKKVKKKKVPTATLR